MERVVARLVVLEGGIPDGQRVEIALDALGVFRRRLYVPVTTGGETEFLQRLAIELQDDGVGPVDEPEVLAKRKKAHRNEEIRLFLLSFSAFFVAITSFIW